MEKKITISSNSKIVALFTDLAKKKDETKKILTEKLIKKGLIISSTNDNRARN